jgi:hypothetical protein
MRCDKEALKGDERFCGNDFRGSILRERSFRYGKFAGALSNPTPWLTNPNAGFFNAYVSLESVGVFAISPHRKKTDLHFSLSQRP